MGRLWLCAGVADLVKGKMTFFQAIILAIIQGATEFIPVSSSGHLVLARSVFGWSDEGGLLFDIVLHAGSLTAILLYFLPEWRKILRALFVRRSDPELAYYRRLPLYLVVATLPVVIVAPLLKDWLETTLRNDLWVGISMMATAAWFIFVERLHTGKASMSFGRSLLTGLAQVIALLPGASRSGWTTGAGIATGLSRTDAIRFAFFMAVPAIAGAVVFEGKDIMKGTGSAVDLHMAIIGFAISLIVSLAAIHFCLRFFRTHTLRPFAIYLAVAGTIVAGLALFH